VGKIVSIHSYRGGTGKSNLVANVAATLALGGRRVGIVDTDIQSPGIHVLFGLDEDRATLTLNHFLHGKCGIEETAYDVTPDAVRAGGGEVRLIPSSVKAGEIARVLREGYDVSRLNDGLSMLSEALRLDYLLIDTHPGLNEETLLSIAISDVLVVLLRPDRQDYQGTAVTVDVARNLEVPAMLLVVNKVLPRLDRDALRGKVEGAYGAPVAGILAECEEMLELASGGLFCLHYPDHSVTRDINGVVSRILAATA
jgi:MinD-like ATPase involved in chromosome partitioning or flagellar assembly